jgi:hypothetical protein
VGDGHWRTEKRSIGLVKVRPILDFGSDVSGFVLEIVGQQEEIVALLMDS